MQTRIEGMEGVLEPMDPLDGVGQSLLGNQNYANDQASDMEWFERRNRNRVSSQQPPLNSEQERLYRESNRRRTELQRQQLEELLALISNELEINDSELEGIIDRRQRDRGMTDAQIQRLSSITVSEDLSQKLKEECCSICLDPFTKDMEVRQMANCGHHFH